MRCIMLRHEYEIFIMLECIKFLFHFFYFFIASCTIDVLELLFVQFNHFLRFIFYFTNNNRRSFALLHTLMNTSLIILFCCDKFKGINKTGVVFISLKITCRLMINLFILQSGIQRVFRFMFLNKANIPTLVSFLFIFKFLIC